MGFIKNLKIKDGIKVFRKELSKELYILFLYWIPLSIEWEYISIIWPEFILRNKNHQSNS